ncbi:MAG: glycosyltransferase [PVC group bacterium]|nr:glycosyltransferase [PVC group bacterium]
MRILYQIPSLESVYAARFIYEGYKDAFLDGGHEFKPYTAQANLGEMLDEFNPHIFISSLCQYSLKFLDLALLKKHRDKGLVFFNQIQPWKKQNDEYCGEGLESQPYLVNLIKDGLAGDVFFYYLPHDHELMQGFTETTGYPLHTVLLAANKKLFFYEYDQKYQADISYVGSLLKNKKVFIKDHLFPLMKKYKVKVYGSDWNLVNKLQGYMQKVGQYFNIEPLKHVRKIDLPIEDERKVYSSSLISLNIHLDGQRKFGSDFNERTFKIIASGGFEICDNVAVLRKYFNDQELVVANNTKDWFEKIDFFIKNPDKRIPIIEAGKKKILAEHTYEHRVAQLIDIYNTIKHGNKPTSN